MRPGSQPCYDSGLAQVRFRCPLSAPPRHYLSASLQCKRENATAVHKNTWVLGATTPWRLYRAERRWEGSRSWLALAMAIFMRLNIFITKIALRGAGGGHWGGQVFRCH